MIMLLPNKMKVTGRKFTLKDTSVLVLCSIHVPFVVSRTLFTSHVMITTAFCIIMTFFAYKVEGRGRTVRCSWFACLRYASVPLQL